MKEFNASYNFPNGFLWGILPEDPLLSSRDSGSLARMMKDSNHNAAFLNLSWGNLQTGVNSFDEIKIGTIRSILSRYRTMNIETLICLDNSVIPSVLSAEKGNTSALQNAFYNFSIHIIDAVLPYTQYLSILKLLPSGGFQKDVQRKLFTDIRNYVISASDKTKTGVTIDRTSGKPSGFKKLFSRQEHIHTNISEAEFSVLVIDGPVAENAHYLSQAGRVPVLTLNRYYTNLPADRKKDSLLEDIFELWQCYQKGINIAGYFPDMNINKSGPMNDLYSSVCKKNALKISTSDPDLTEKWIRFLKD